MILLFRKILSSKYSIPHLLFPSVLFSTLFIISCSSSAKFASKEEIKIEETGKAIRVLLNETEGTFTYVVKNQLSIRDESKKIALIKAGSSMQFIPDGFSTILKLGNKNFKSDYFLLENDDNPAVTKFNGNIYTGIVKVLSSDGNIKVINTLSLEDYIKGVLPFEMPVGKGESYIESYKAMAICARTYAVNKIKEGGPLFDIYSDTRDQMYGGTGKGNLLSDKAVDDTKALILVYGGEPAVVFYHSTCGGTTEKAENVFSKKDIPYLRGIKDGNSPVFCSESPRFTWKEIYDSRLFINRLFQAKLLKDTNFELKKIHVKSRFESGRINELQILLADKKNTPKTLSLFGNGMRWVLRTADNSSILRSTSFDINFERNTVTLSGRGFGHGVGLCQWGAMYMSAHGKDFNDILAHYYPGTTLTEWND